MLPINLCIVHKALNSNRPFKFTAYLSIFSSSYLSKTSMCFSRQPSDSPTGNYTLTSPTLGDTDGVDHLILIKQLADMDLLLEIAVGKIDFLSDLSPIYLNLHHMGLLLIADPGLSDLGMRQNPDDGAVLFQICQLILDLVVLVLLAISAKLFLIISFIQI